MTRSEEYKSLAANAHERARKETSPILKAEWEKLAERYIWLANSEGKKKHADESIIAVHSRH